MAYDRKRLVTVLFGGSYRDGGETVVLGDTWEWNGNIWLQRAAHGPLPRRAHTMTYDDERGVTVLVAGAGFDGLGTIRLADTWEWDGRTWTMRPASGLTPRSGHAMAYDSARGTSVLFGGYTEEYGDSGETLEFGRSQALGDLNCDCTVDAFDVEPFIVAMFEPKRYASRYPDCDIDLADMNRDGAIDARDIESFLESLFP